MSEPTKEQIDEAREMVPIFDGYLSTVNGCPHISVHGLARLIAHVRKQARDDALEGARLKLESMRAIKKNVAAVTRYQFEHDEVIDSCITALDALKDKPDGEQP